METIYNCKRCNITSETCGRMCPCPRGGCEAVEEKVAKTYTQEEVVNLILQERNRCRKICDDHSQWFERRIKEFPSTLKRMYEEGKDACRRIRISVSEVTAFDFENKTDEQKIIEKYKL